MLVEAVLWIARTGSHWRDLPTIFGKWNSVFVRFNRWSEGGVWQRIFATLADDPDFEYLILDLHHRASTPACGWRKRGTQNQAIGRSRGGLTSKIQLAVRGLGLPVRQEGKSIKQICSDLQILQHTGAASTVLGDRRLAERQNPERPNDDDSK